MMRHTGILQHYRNEKERVDLSNIVTDNSNPKSRLKSLLSRTYSTDSAAASPGRRKAMLVSNKDNSIKRLDSGCITTLVVTCVLITNLGCRPYCIQIERTLLMDRRRSPAKGQLCTHPSNTRTWCNNFPVKNLARNLLQRHHRSENTCFMVKIRCTRIYSMTFLLLRMLSKC